MDEVDYRDIADSIQDGLTIVRAGKVAYISDRACEIVGYSREELLTMTSQDFAAEEDKTRLKLLLDRSTKSELLPKEVEFGIIRKDGTRGVIRNRYSRLKHDPDKKAYLIVTTDITGQKVAEQVALRERDRANSLLDIAGVIILALDLEGKVTLVNVKAGEILGYSTDEIMGREWTEVFLPERTRKKLKSYFKALKSGRLESAEYVENPVLTRSGQERIIAWHNSLILDEEGRVAGTLSSGVDITEKRLMEQDLKQSREHLRQYSRYLQEQLERERKHLAAEIHDELGQLLTGLKIDLSWLSNRLPAGDEALAAKSGSMLVMLAETDKIARRIVADLRPVVLDDLGLSAALRWLVQQFRTRTGMDCSLVIKPAEIKLDKDLSVDIFRIVQEALTNVTRHSEATQVEVKLRATGRSMELSVRDNGRGVTAAEVEKRGSFGLTGMRERAARWEGSLEIKGYPHKGTEIKVSLPQPGPDSVSKHAE